MNKAEYEEAVRIRDAREARERIAIRRLGPWGWLCHWYIDPAMQRLGRWVQRRFDPKRGYDDAFEEAARKVKGRPPLHLDYTRAQRIDAARREMRGCKPPTQ